MALIPGYDSFATAEEGQYFDEFEAQKAIDYIERCCCFTKDKWMGKPLKLEDWQKGVVAAIFGWKDADGRRRYTEVFLYVPRKNGKTEFCAALANKFTFADGTAGGEIYVAAADQSQASICWEASVTMIHNEPEMKKRCKIFRSRGGCIEVEKTRTVYKPISNSKDGKTKHGKNPSALLIDELHCIDDEGYLESIESAQGARTEPIKIYLTTADTDRLSPCNERYFRACKVRDGEHPDATILPIIYEADEKTDDWKDPAVWKKANPNFGVSLQEKYFMSELNKAISTPSYENTFKRLYLNMRTGSTSRWINSEAWEACDKDDLRPEDLKGQLCYGGLDLASKVDLTSFVLFFPEFNALLCWVWLPEMTAKSRSEKNRVPYLNFAKEGCVKLTPGNVCDYDIVERDIVALRDLYNIKEIAFDVWNATQITTHLGYEGFEMVEFRQGFRSMSTPTKELESLVIDGKLRHFGNPILKWCISNVILETDAAENVKASKKHSTEKIDPIIAAIMAIGRKIYYDLEPEVESIYETRGLITI